MSTPGFLQLAGGDFAFEPLLSESASGGGVEDVLAEVDVAFFHPPENDGGGDEDGGVGADEDTGEDGEREVAEGGTTHEEEEEDGDQGTDGGQQRSAESAADGVVHDFAQVTLLGGEVFANAVEDDDGVIDRVSGDGEQGADLQEVDVAPSQDEQADAEDEVMEQGGESAQREGEFEAHREVGGDAEHADDEGEDRGPKHFCADLGTDFFDVAAGIGEVFAARFFDGFNDGEA